MYVCYICVYVFMYVSVCVCVCARTRAYPFVCLKGSYRRLYAMNESNNIRSRIPLLLSRHLCTSCNLISSIYNQAVHIKIRLIIDFEWKDVS